MAGGLPDRRLAEIEVLVFFMPQRLARVAGHWVTVSEVSQVTDTLEAVGGGGGKGDAAVAVGVWVFTAVVGVGVVAATEVSGFGGGCRSLPSPKGLVECRAWLPRSASSS
jgi:hypothetical protein